MSGKSAKGPAKKGKKQTEEDDTITCDGCDRDFLFEDVGLTPAKVPEGKWFCPDCEKDDAVICDSCHREFLFKDVGFTRETVPEGDWFCSIECESKGKTHVKNKKKSEICFDRNWWCKCYRRHSKNIIRPNEGYGAYKKAYTGYIR